MNDLLCLNCLNQIQHVLHTNTPRRKQRILDKLLKEGILDLSIDITTQNNFIETTNVGIQIESHIDSGDDWLS